MIEQNQVITERDAPISTEDITLLCKSKAEEFQMLGYEYVSAEDIWACVSSKYKKTGQPNLHKIVNDILSLKPTQYMNYMTMEAYRGSPL